MCTFQSCFKGVAIRVLLNVGVNEQARERNLCSDDKSSAAILKNIFKMVLPVKQ